MGIENTEAEDRVRQALAASESSLLATLGAFYQQMGIIFGLRLREGIESYDQMVIAGASVVEGLGLRHQLAPELVDRPVEIVNDLGEKETWHLAALAYYGVFMMLTEEDPGYDPDAALAAYLESLSGG